MIVEIDVNPITIADRLRRVAQTMTEENNHTEAMICEQAADVIGALVRDIRAPGQVHSGPGPIIRLD